MRGDVCLGSKAAATPFAPLVSRRFIGTAGSSIPRALADRFPGDGTHLHRYARRLSGVEINSSFYRPHAAGTYARWASSTPPGFRFAVKIPRAITHERKLVGAETVVQQFVGEIAGLGDKLGPLLVQLPPSLVFDVAIAESFFSMLRQHHDGDVACEPRHGSWFATAPDALLQHYRVARAAADPAVAPGADAPGGWRDLAYFRLHGSPRKYWSSYSQDRLEQFAHAIRSADSGAVWCIFDNTASGAALENAGELVACLERA